MKNLNDKTDKELQTLAIDNDLDVSKIGLSIGKINRTYIINALEKPNFKKTSRYELKRLSIGGYNINPRHSAAAQIELDRRDHKTKMIAIILSITSLLSIMFWQSLNYFFPKPLPTNTNNQVNAQQNNNNTKQNDSK